MDRNDAIEALRATGDELEASGFTEPVNIVLAGAVAAMVTGGLPASRGTHDCDVVLIDPDDRWNVVRNAARAVARQRRLPPDWFNRDSQMYAYLLPLGWRGRCEAVGSFGPLVVTSVGRRDLLAMKLAGSPVRPQDQDDLVSMKPTTEELTFLEEHLDRLEAESLAGETFEAQRAILDQLRLAS